MDKLGNISPKKSSVASKEEFEKLQMYVNNTIKEIGKEILNGNICLKPYYKNKKTPCQYCAYKNMCGFDSGIFKTEYNFINKKQKEDIIKKAQQLFGEMHLYYDIIFLKKFRYRGKMKLWKN